MNFRTIRTLVAAFLMALAIASPRPAQAKESRKVINRVNPVYLPLARKMNVARTVKVEVTNFARRQRDRHQTKPW